MNLYLQKNTLLFTFCLLAIAFTGCSTKSKNWNKNSVQYGTVLAREYPAAMDRGEVLLSIGQPTATYEYDLENGWPSVMDSYLKTGVKKLETDLEVYPIRIDVYNRFLAKYQNHSGNFDRFVDYLFYDVNDELVATHRRSIN